MVDGHYLAEIERAFLALNGRGLMLSAADVELVARWARAGVPLTVVLETLDRIAERRRPVRSLRYMADAVTEAMRGWQARRVGAHVHDVQAAPAIDQAFGALLQRIAAARGPWAATCAGRLRTLQAAFHRRELPDPGAALDALEAELADAMLAERSPEQRAELLSEIEARHARVRRTTSAEDWLATVRTQLRRRVWEAHRLPPLVLDLGSGW